MSARPENRSREGMHDSREAVPASLIAQPNSPSLRHIIGRCARMFITGYRHLVTLCGDTQICGELIPEGFHMPCHPSRKPWPGGKWAEWGRGFSVDKRAI